MRDFSGSLLDTIFQFVILIIRMKMIIFNIASTGNQSSSTVYGQLTLNQLKLLAAVADKCIEKTACTPSPTFTKP